MKRTSRFEWFLTALIAIPVAIGALAFFGLPWLAFILSILFPGAGH